MKQNVRLLSRIFFIITVFWKSRYQTCRIIFSNLRCVVTHISAHRHVIYIYNSDRKKHGNICICTNSQEKSTLLAIHDSRNPRNSTNYHLPFISNRVELYPNPLSNPLSDATIKLSRISSPSLSHACSPIDRYSDRSRSTRVLSKRKREKRERVPRPILDRNEANGRRIVGPGFRAGNFSYARFRGKNKTGCRKRNERRSSPPGGHLPVYRRHALSARYGQGRKRF